MMEWKETTLGEVCVLITDGAHNSPKTVDVGFPMASVKDLTPHGINVSTCRLISDDDYQRLVRQQCQPVVGDVLIAKDGNSALDTVCEITKPLELVLLSSVAMLRPNLTKVRSSFLRYYLDCDSTRQYLKSGFITGAAIPRVIVKDFKRARIHVPSLPVQRKIASILSAYDDLIENNTRRIAILEEMAQAIYREWFVNFRFPGHENVKLVDSPLGQIPEGWTLSTMDALCSRITDGAHKSPKSVDEGLPMASMKDMETWRLDLSTARKITQDDFEELVRMNCKPLKGDVLIAKDGASYLKYIFVVEEEQEVVLLSSVAILRPNGTLHPHLMAMTLNDPQTKGRLANYVTGAAIPRVILKDFKRFEITVPPSSVQLNWWATIDPTIQLIHRLLRKNDNLRTTRALLLPKLISGHLDVEDLDIDMPESNEE